jgi:predicted O-methyltransferase YrrM
MRERQTKITPELQNYLETNFTAEDDFLKELVAESWTNEGIPQINITGFQANFLQFLVKSINAKNILEIGTLAGYSAIILARAAGKDAKILTIEKNKKHFDYANKKIEQLNLQNQVEILNVDAKKFIKSYKSDELFDLIFVDADKSQYYDYLVSLTPHLKKGGLFVADNALAFGFLLTSAPEKNPTTMKSMKNFHEYLLSREDYFTTLVPIGDGLLVSVKL